MDKTIIMRDSDQAASLRTVTGWFSRHGRFYGEIEDAARYDGCTHVKCKNCGAPTEKCWLSCSECRAIFDTKKFEAMPRKEWDGESPLYSLVYEEYFSDISHAETALADGQTLEDLRLVICEPNYPRQLEEYFFEDQLSEDDELPSDLVAAIGIFNMAVTKSAPISWSPGKFALATVTGVEHVNVHS